MFNISGQCRIKYAGWSILDGFWNVLFGVIPCGMIDNVDGLLRDDVWTLEGKSR